jgi:uncharacterized protein with ATP-grasp and redox domains
MKLQLECLACILEDVLDAGSLLLKKKDLEKLALESVTILAGFDPEKTPSYYITRVHRKLKELAQEPAPFLKKRRATNRVVNRIAARIGKTIKPDWAGFRRLLKWVVWSNTLDFRTAGKGYRFGPKKIEAELQRAVKKGLAVDDTKKIWHAIEKARTILYILDNVGEIAFDKILIEKFLARKNVIACVRGGVMTSDAIIEDLKAIGLEKVVARTIISGTDTLGVLREEISPELKNALERAGFIIAKGQANFYFFSSYPEMTHAPVACLFTTKCEPVARMFKKSGKFAVAKIMKK